MHVGAIYAKVAWYIGVIGFLFFFLYKFKISKARAHAIMQTKLLDNVGRRAPLDDEEYRLLDVILCSLSSKKEMVNYMFIFALSAAALIWAVYMDFIK